MKKVIPQCFDSHVHFMATGQAADGLDLSGLQSAQDFQNLKLKENYFRGEWLVGFGWDQNKWPGGRLPTRQDLDLFFKEIPVCFTRADGHASWLNTRALEILKYDHSVPDRDGGLIVRDSDRRPTGILLDMAKIDVDLRLPDFSRAQKKNFLLAAIQKFNRAGFTHLRDMSGSLEQWQLLGELEKESALHLYVDQFFTCEDLQDLPRVLQVITQVQQEPCRHQRVCGVKFFVDGALGSEGAYLSQNYEGQSGRGLLIWKMEELKQAVGRCWQLGFQVAIHVIGDEAAHQVIRSCHDLTKTGPSGILNLEHTQLLRPESIKLLRDLKVTCHMQPCHWLSDRAWLEKKLGRLYSYVFPWAALRKSQIPLQWGSDSPIESPSITNTLQALRDSAEQRIPGLSEDPFRFFSHPDSNWGSGCKTLVDGTGAVLEVWFDQQQII